MSAFTKLDSGIVHSTIWVQPHDVLRVWIALLALADQHGEARTAAPAMANLCMIPVDRMREIIAILESPDEDSRSEAEEGRRIIKIVGGWRLVNHGAYRNRRDPETDRERKREWDREHRPSGHSRAKQSDDSPTTVRQSDSNPLAPTQAEAEADTEKARATGQQAALAPAFLRFWTAYPLKKGKVAAMKAWPKAMTKTTLDALLTALAAQVAGDDEWKRGFVPRASTYLNGEFWNDELAKPKPDLRGGPAINTAVPRGKPAADSESPLEAAILRAKHLRAMDAIDDAALELEIQRVTKLHRGEEAPA